MTAALYAPSLSWGYVYEDTVNLQMPLTWREWRAGITSPAVMPSRWLSVTMQTAIGVATDHDPFWQRLASLVLHLLNGTLLWVLASRLRLGIVGSAMAAGLFLLHPIQSEAVAAVANRTELLIALSALTAIWCAERSVWWLAWGLALLAVMVKPAGIVVLGLVPVWAWWRGLPSWTPIYWAAACCPIVLIGLDGVSGGMGMRLLWSSPAEAVLTATAWSVLLAQWVWPVGLSFDPDWANITTPPVVAVALGAWAIMSVLTRRCQWVALIVVWATVGIAPRLPWQLGEGLHEHHLYLMTVALSLGTGRLFSQEHDR